MHGKMFCRLAKVRLGLLVLFATAAGFGLGGGEDAGRLVFTLLGTGLVSGGAATLNQVLEIRWDAQMLRTCARPLPSGRVAMDTACLLGVGMALVGAAVLAWKTTGLAACLALGALAVYLVFYTPMKRRSAACKLVGAAAGAMPPVIGWAAVDGRMGWGSVFLFGVLFAWQMPHLLTIAWLHRADYAHAGFTMLPAGDTGGRSTALQALVFSAVLAGMTFVPFSWETLFLNALLLFFAWRFFQSRSRASARHLFVFSIVYLPALLTILLMNKR